jgi:hypothetical protein
VNKNQILILQEVANNSNKTISSLLFWMERKFKIPLSTLKLNAKILKELNLIDFGNSSVAKLTRLGKFMVEVIGIEEEMRGEPKWLVD